MGKIVFFLAFCIAYYNKDFLVVTIIL